MISGESFEERIGRPDEIDAALGRIATNLVWLENELSKANVILSGSDRTDGADPTFAQQLKMFESLCRRPDMLGRLNVGMDDPSDSLTELVAMCAEADYLGRNAIRSDLKRNLSRRPEAIAPGRPKGLLVRFELLDVDGAALLDIADYIGSAALYVEDILFLLSFRGESTNQTGRGTEDSNIMYHRSGSRHSTR